MISTKDVRETEVISRNSAAITLSQWDQPNSKLDMQIINILNSHTSANTTMAHIYHIYHTPLAAYITNNAINIPLPNDTVTT